MYYYSMRANLRNTNCTLLAWIRAPSAIRLVTSVAVKEVSCSIVFQMTKGVLFIEVFSFQMP